jgi:hypothetical protein
MKIRTVFAHNPYISNEIRVYLRGQHVGTLTFPVSELETALDVVDAVESVSKCKDCGGSRVEGFLFIKDCSRCKGTGWEP